MPLQDYVESNEHAQLLKIRDSLFKNRHTVANPRHTGFRKIVILLLITGTVFVALGGIMIRNGITIPAYVFFTIQALGVATGIRRSYKIGKRNPVFRIIRWKSTEFLRLKLGVAFAILLSLASSVFVLVLGLEGAYLWVVAASILRVVALSSIFLFLDKMIVNKATDIEKGNTVPVDVNSLLYDRVSHTNRRMDQAEGQDTINPEK